MMRRKTRYSQRQAATIIPVIAFYAIAIAMIGVWVKAALGHQRLVNRWHQKTQVTWLAEAGVRRAVARLEAEANYPGETWGIPATKLARSSAAQVEIEIRQAGDNRALLEPGATRPSAVEITAVARYPVDALQRVQATKTILYRFAKPTGASGETR